MNAPTTEPRHWHPKSPDYELSQFLPPIVSVFVQTTSRTNGASLSLLDKRLALPIVAI